MGKGNNMHNSNIDKELIKSFEEGGEIVGDILTKGKVHREIKIGVLTCGYFEYWRMFPNMLENVRNDFKQFEKNVSERYKKVVFSGMVDTLDSADRAGKLFKDEQVDVILLVYGTYTADFITLTALDYVKNLPLIVFSMQNHESIDRKGDYEGSLRNSSVIGISQLTGTLRKLERDYKIIVGSINDDRAYRKIDVYVKALQAIEDLREANIGIIGHVFRGMYDLELSKTFLKRTFGVNIITIQSSHLVDIWENVTEEEVDTQTKKLTDRFKRKGVSVEDIKRAVRLAVAMKKLAKKLKLNALCFLDQHYLQKQFNTSARIGSSLLMEEENFSANCEGDLCGLVTMMMMKSISKRSAFMGEWGEYDIKTNSCMLMGHGVGTPDLAESDDKVCLARTPEEWGMDNGGLNYEFIVQSGPATIAHMMEVKNGYKMILSNVESIEFEKIEYDEIYAMFRVNENIKDYLERIFNYGVSHHCIMGLGDISEELNAVCDYLKLDRLFIKGV